MHHYPLLLIVFKQADLMKQKWLDWAFLLLKAGACNQNNKRLGSEWYEENKEIHIRVSC